MVEREVGRMKKCLNCGLNIVQDYEVNCPVCDKPVGTINVKKEKKQKEEK
jgi:uncharacterized Zn finger protein (UPF0148 family)